MYVILTEDSALIINTLKFIDNNFIVGKPINIKIHMEKKMKGPGVIYNAFLQVVVTWKRCTYTYILNG